MEAAIAQAAQAHTLAAQQELGDSAPRTAGCVHAGQPPHLLTFPGAQSRSQGWRMLHLQAPRTAALPSLVAWLALLEVLVLACSTQRPFFVASFAALL